MIYDFLAVPRNQGTYEIPAVEFVYYDVSTNTYKTIKTQSFKLEVAKGDGNGSSPADYSDLKNQDIHPIRKVIFRLRMLRIYSMAHQHIGYYYLYCLSCL